MTSAHEEALREFLSEAREGVGALATAFGAARTSPPGEADLVRLQRAAHTVQGAAGFFALGRVERLARAIEEALAARRAAGGPLDDEAIDALRAGTEALAAVLDGVATTGREAPVAVDEALAGLEVARGRATSPAGGRPA